MMIEHFCHATHHTDVIGVDPARPRCDHYVEGYARGFADGVSRDAPDDLADWLKELERIAP